MNPAANSKAFRKLNVNAGVHVGGGDCVGAGVGGAVLSRSATSNEPAAPAQPWTKILISSPGCVSKSIAEY